MMDEKKLETNSLIREYIERLINSINYKIKENIETIDEIAMDIEDESTKKCFYLGFEDIDLRLIRYCLTKTLDNLSLKNKFLEMIKENKFKFEGFDLSEKAMSIAIESLMLLDYFPDSIEPTFSDSLRLRYLMKNNSFELEFFNDGDIVFVNNDDEIIDISKDQLYEKISIINKKLMDQKTKLTIENHPACPKCGSKNTKIIPANCSWEGPTCWSQPICEDCGFCGYASSKGKGIYWYG